VSVFAALLGLILISPDLHFPQQVVDQAVDAMADTATIEFAKAGSLEVLFVVGNMNVGGILADRTLEAVVMTLIHERAGLEK